jgi:hypothetical protein
MVDKRAALRFPTDLEANCRAPESAWDSQLCNISTSGCMIALPEGDLADHAPLRLRIKGLAAIDAEVIWQHRGHAGVRFRVPLHPAAMEHLGFVLPEGAWESACRTGQDVETLAPRLVVATPARRTASAGLNGQLVKRTPEPAELHG